MHLDYSLCFREHLESSKLVEVDDNIPLTDGKQKPAWFLCMIKATSGGIGHVGMILIVILYLPHSEFRNR